MFWDCGDQLEAAELRLVRQGTHVRRPRACERSAGQVLGVGARVATKAMQGWAWWTLSAPLGVFGIPSSCTRRVVLVATLGTRCSKSSYASLRKRAD